jgi:hypothetical protein
MQRSLTTQEAQVQGNSTRIGAAHPSASHGHVDWPTLNMTSNKTMRLLVDRRPHETLTWCISKKRLLDIVVVHCRHSTQGLRESLGKIMSLETVASRSPCLHIYTKSCYPHAVADLTASFPEAARIIKQVNMGREGAAYLEYILEHYHHLPQHVLFLQDDMARNANDMLPRLRRAFK